MRKTLSLLQKSGVKETRSMSFLGKLKNLPFLVFTALIFCNCAFAEDQPAQIQPSLGETLGKMFPMFILVSVIYYLMIFKPQANKIKTQQALLSGLKKGDTVVTTSGIVGKVAQAEGEFIVLEVAPNTKLKFEAQSVTKRLETGTPSNSNG